MDKKNVNLKLADILRNGFNQYLKEAGPLPYHYYKVVNAILSCKTAELGGHIYRCDECSHDHIAYNSCRNRHCPTCQAHSRYEWVKARVGELLPVPYFHVVFTIPHQLNPIALRNKKPLYNILLKAASETLIELSKDQKWVGGEIGFMTILHTWGQNLMEHPHVHCVVPGGGIRKDKKKWKHCRKDFLFPFEVMRQLFRGKFMQLFKQAVLDGRIDFQGNTAVLKRVPKYKALLNSLYRIKWNVYAKPPFAGPEEVIKYLSGYTHRIAISNHRLVSFKNGKVAFKYKDYQDNNKTKIMTLDITEFIRRFLLHILPSRFTRIRYYGFLSNRKRKDKLAKCRELLEVKNQTPQSITQKYDIDTALAEKTQMICPVCGKGHMKMHKEIPRPYKAEYMISAA